MYCALMLAHPVQKYVEWNRLLWNIYFKALLEAARMVENAN